MLKLVLAVTAIGLFLAAVVTNWRVAGLMIAAWWADNLLKKLRERENG